MRIQNNITAMNTHRMYTANNNAVTKSAEKLSSGYRINRAGDDAAGLAISEKMRSQVRGLSMASKNSQDAISLIQTAEGALQEVHGMLQRMNELAVQSATGTNEDFDRQQIDAEFNQLKAEIDDIADSTNFNNMKLLNGDLSGSAPAGAIATAAGMNKGVALNSNAAVINDVTNLSGKAGVFTFTAASNDLTVRFTETGTGNVTNTTVDLSKATTGDVDAANGAIAAGGRVRVDLTEAGFGIVELTAVGANATWASLATTLASAPDTTTTATVGSGNGLTIQVGALQGDELSFSIDAMSSAGLGLTSVKIDNQDVAKSAITATRAAINTVSEQRSTLGAMQNRLEHKIANLDNTVENLSAAESRIRDVDLAKEMTSYTKNNILSQAATAMLAQANAAPQNVLSLLQ